MQEMQVQSLGWEDSPGEGNGNALSILAWRNPWTEGPGGLQSTGLQRARHGWSNWAEQSKIKKNCSLATPKFYILDFGEIWEHRPVRKMKKRKPWDRGTKPSSDQSPARDSGVQMSCRHLKAALNQPVLEPVKVWDANTPHQCLHTASTLQMTEPTRCALRGLGGTTVPVFFLQNSLPYKARMSPSIFHSLYSSTALFLVFCCCCCLAVLNLNSGMWTLSCSMWDQVSWPGMEPGPPAFGVQSLSPWTIGEVPPSSFYSNYKYSRNMPHSLPGTFLCLSLLSGTKKQDKLGRMETR